MKRLMLGGALLLLAIPTRAQKPNQPLKQGITVDLAGGYAYTKFNNAGSYPNMNGLFGTVGVNITPWLQVQADASKQFGSITGAKTRIYGNHFGPRFFYRPRHSALSAFGEFLAGGSRLDLILSGPGGAKFSENGFSIKTGGGVDVQISQHWAVRAFDADLYRTPFLKSHQNSLWLASGIVYTFGRNHTPH